MLARQAMLSFITVALWARGASMVEAAGVRQEDCDGKESFYIMGYGSLLNFASRIRTACGIQSLIPSVLDSLVDSVQFQEDTQRCIDEARKRQGEILPVRVRGVRRGWYESTLNLIPQTFRVLQHQGLFLLPMFLGAVEDADAEMYGLIYPVDEAELNATDKREHTYNHKFLEASEISLLNASHSMPKCAKVRWYESRNVATVTKENPLAQSYIDIFLQGALEIQESLGPGSTFLTQVIQTTFGWSRYWVNDRTSAYAATRTVKDFRAISVAMLSAPVTAEVPSSARALPKEALQPLTQDMVQSVGLSGTLQLRDEMESRLQALASEQTETKGMVNSLLVTSVVLSVVSVGLLMALVATVRRLPPASQEGVELPNFV